MSDIIHNNFINHLAHPNILFDHQFGLRERMSCETQLIQAVVDLAKCLSEGGQIDVVLLNFSKYPTTNWQLNSIIKVCEGKCWNW